MDQTNELLLLHLYVCPRKAKSSLTMSAARSATAYTATTIFPLGMMGMTLASTCRKFRTPSDDCPPQHLENMCHMGGNLSSHKLASVLSSLRSYPLDFSWEVFFNQVAECTMPKVLFLPACPTLEHAELEPSHRGDVRSSQSRPEAESADLPKVMWTFSAENWIALW